VRRSLCGLMIVTCVAAIIGLQCGEKGTEPEPIHYGISPDSTAVEVSSTQQFSATFEAGPVDVIWYVDGVRGGSPETGMITPDGLFVAPHEVPTDGYVTITAEAVVDSSVQESAKAVIQSGYGAVFIQVSPDSQSIALGDSVAFSPAPSGCPLADPEWSITPVSGVSGPVGEIRPNGTYLAPASITGDVILMVTVESPDCPGKKGIAKAVVKKPEVFAVRFEDFSDSSGTNISRLTTCSEGGHVVNGLDNPGEWVQVNYEVRAGGEYAAVVRYEAGIGDVLTVTVTEMGCPDSSSPQEVSFVLDAGNGLT
jgi:hypothetical protein